MTICIASICNLGEFVNSPAIVFCADRLISASDSVSTITFEHGNSKVKWLKDRGVILEAGNASTSDLVIDKEILSDKVASMTIKEISELLYKKMIDLKTKKINHILSDFGLNQKNFIETPKNIPDNFFFELTTTISDLDLGMEFIVAGLDRDGSPQLYVVSDEKGIECFNTMGFVAIGSGNSLSFLEMTKSVHNNYVHVGVALGRVYSGKKNAERISSVGKKTNLGFLYLLNDKDKGFNVGVTEINEEYQKKIDEHLKVIQETEDKVHKKVSEMLKKEVYPEEERDAIDPKKLGEKGENKEKDNRLNKGEEKSKD